MPRDKNDIGKGWVPLKIPEVADGDTKGKGVKKGSVLNASPLGAGLKDGAMLAFRFGKVLAEEEDDENEEDDDDDEMDVDDRWDVIIPSYDDEVTSER